MDHKFLLSRHTESKVDSVHASNERCSKHVSVYTPRYSCRTINMVRPRNPFKDLSVWTLQCEIPSWMTVVRKLKVYIFCYIRDDEYDIVLYKYNFSGDFKSFPLHRTNARRNSSQAVLSLQETPLHHKPLLVTESKKNDFLGEKG